MLLFPLTYPTFEAAFAYARFLGRQSGCDVRMNNSDGGQVDLIQIRFKRSQAGLKMASSGRSAVDLQASNLELRQQIDSMTRLEWEILETNEREHRRFGWDLHEDLGQQLVGITFLASLIAKQLEANCPDLGDELGELVSQLRNAVARTRNIARGLYPIGLENAGLFMVLEEFAGWITQFEGTPCDFVHDDGFEFPEESAIHLYRIAQEAVNYLLKGGKCRRISVECVSLTPESLNHRSIGARLAGIEESAQPVPTLIVTGTGVESGEASSDGGGLELMHSRARMIGAEISLGETPDGGCVIACVLKGMDPSLRERPAHFASAPNEVLNLGEIGSPKEEGQPRG